MYVSRIQPADGTIAVNSSKKSRRICNTPEVNKPDSVSFKAEMSPLMKRYAEVYINCYDSQSSIMNAKGASAMFNRLRNIVSLFPNSDRTEYFDIIDFDDLPDTINNIRYAKDGPECFAKRVADTFRGKIGPLLVHNGEAVVGLANLGSFGWGKGENIQIIFNRPITPDLSEAAIASEPHIGFFQDEDGDIGFGSKIYDLIKEKIFYNRADAPYAGIKRTLEPERTPSGGWDSSKMIVKHYDLYGREFQPAPPSFFGGLKKLFGF